MALRKNGQTIDASWFNVVEEAATQYEYDFDDGQSETPLTGQTFDGETVSSVEFTFESQRPGLFHNGRFKLQFKDSTWRKVGEEFDGDEEDHGLTFGLAQEGNVVNLTLSVSSGPGAGELKLKRAVFNA